MKVVDAFVQPILEDALRRAREAKSSGLLDDHKNGEIKDDDCLLDHLVKHTEGPSLRYFLLCTRTSYLSLSHI